MLDEHIRRGDAGALELAHHVLGDLDDLVNADMDAKLLLLLNEQQPLVGLPLDLPALLPGILIRPVAGHEESAQKDFVPGLDVIPFRDALAIDRAQIDGHAAGVVQLGVGREEDNEADNRERDNDRPQPGLMLTNRPKHNFNCLSERAP